MKPFVRRTCWAVAMALTVVCAPAWAGWIQVSKPKANGTDEFWLTSPGFGFGPFQVAISKNDSAAQKAQKIVNAFNAGGLLLAQIDPTDPTRVLLGANLRATMTKAGSAEKTVIQNDPVASPAPNATTMKISAPSRNGKDEFVVTVGGVKVGPIEISVQQADTAAGKALKIVQALNAGGLGLAAIDPNDPSTILLGPGVTVAMTKNRSGEPTISIKVPSPDAGKAKARVTFDKAPPLPADAEFNATFGYTDPSTGTSTYFGADDTGTSEADALKNMVDQLTAEGAPFFVEDSATASSLFFDFPVGMTDLFVAGWGTNPDIGVTAAIVMAAPEPASVALVFMAVACAAGVRRRTGQPRGGQPRRA